jgi:hypothetical protein
MQQPTEEWTIEYKSRHGAKRDNFIDHSGCKNGQIQKCSVFLGRIGLTLSAQEIRGSLWRRAEKIVILVRTGTFIYFLCPNLDYSNVAMRCNFIVLASVC